MERSPWSGPRQSQNRLLMLLLLAAAMLAVLGATNSLLSWTARPPVTRSVIVVPPPPVTRPSTHLARTLPQPAPAALPPPVREPPEAVGEPFVPVTPEFDPPGVVNHQGDPSARAPSDDPSTHTPPQDQGE